LAEGKREGRRAKRAQSSKLTCYKSVLLLPTPSVLETEGVSLLRISFLRSEVEIVCNDEFVEFGTVFALLDEKCVFAGREVVGYRVGTAAMTDLVPHPF